MFQSNKKIIRAIWKLEDNTQISGSQRLTEIHTRLIKGRKNFQDAVNRTLNSAMKISALDLNVRDKALSLKSLSGQLADISGEISSSAGITASVAGEVVQSYDNLVDSIAEVSENAGNVMEGIAESQKKLDEIVDMSRDAIEESGVMEQDMSSLLEVVKHMQSVIASINSISGQTNLLALNASIEAARAGEAGKGFAVVAEEIRQLAEETKNLTNNMASFVTNIEHASEKSAKSVGSTAKSLGSIQEGLEVIRSINQEELCKVEEINGTIENIASVSKEINESMSLLDTQITSLNGGSELVNQDAERVKGISTDLLKVIEPIGIIESQLDETAALMGNMVLDHFYMIDNGIFIQSINSAIDAHKIWVSSLKEMVDKQCTSPLQTNPKKCAFGHFYYAMKPKNQEVAQIWKSVEEKHRSLHEGGGIVIKAIEDGNIHKAEEAYKRIYDLSMDLIGNFEAIKAAAEKLTQNKKNVFEAI